jgi:glycosyltransferase involved in cell wall biosynthesis
MNILIHLENISKKNGGIFQYSIGLLNILKKDTSNNYFILSNNEEINELIKEITHFKKVKFVEKVENIWLSRLNRAFNKLSFKLPKQQLTYTEKLIKAYNIDVVHCPHQSYIETGKTPFISTMHDVQELHFPEFFSSDERIWRAVNAKKAIENSDKVIVSYNHIKQDLVNLFSVNKDDIEVILINMSKLWIENFKEKDVIPKEDLDVPSHYLLYPAATWKHKNHLFLLKALKSLKDDDIKINIIFTGHLTDYFSSVIKPFLENNDLENQCVFKGIVSDRELFSLYKNSIGVVIPSLYEAGSFPLYESIITNTPVICSNVTSLPETINDENLVFDPSDIESLKIILKKLYYDVKFQNHIKEHLISQYEYLKQNNSLEKFLNIYHELKIN